MTGRPSRASARGFTLLELLVVVALLALVTATVTMRLGHTMGPAALGQAVSEWEFADQQLRVKASRSGKPVALGVEIGTNRLECEFDKDMPPAARSLGSHVRLTKYLSSTEEISYGPLAIRYTDRGASRTYAVELTGGRRLRRWLVVAGITGQITEVADEKAAREILQVLSPEGVFAH